MSFLKKITLVLLFLFPISNSFASMVTLVDRQIFDDGGQAFQNGIVFNPDGTKMFVSPQASTGNSNIDFIYEYNLSTPFDISTKTYAGDDERCDLDVGAGEYGLNPENAGDMAFSSDGLKIFVVSRGTNGSNNDRLYRYDLTIAYDVSTCAFVKDVDPDDDTLAGTSFGGRTDKSRYHAQGIEINTDGTKIFLVFNDVSSTGDGIKEYNLSTPYDLATMSLVTSGGIDLANGESGFNPDALFIGLDGKRLFVSDHAKLTITQFTLDNSYDTSSFTKDGSVSIQDLTSDNNNQTRALGFSKNGLKMFVSDDTGDDEIFEFDLACPFNIIAGKCPSITKNNDRTGMAEAQIEVARRTIENSTDNALNRLKWIRRNKDTQNLTNQNIKLNFSNQMLASLSEVVKISTKPKKKIKNQDVFYWSEGSIAIGRVGDTDISSTKKIGTNAITIGADKFTKNKGIRGLAFRIGRNNIDVGTKGSNLDTDTYNLTYYATAPIKNDTKFIDTIIGIGALKSDILTVLDGKNITADRKGKQIYGTIKLKDEIEKDNLTLISAGQIDLGYTSLDDYQESGTAAMNFDKQSIHSRNVRLSIAAVEELENDKFKMKRHGKLEYKTNLHRSSNIKYSYTSDTANLQFDTKLNSGALHNLNGEVGIDIIFPEHYSVFIIYERSHAFGTGYTDNIYIALGYLPYEDTEYAFSINGSENLMSKFVLKKKINGYDLIFNLNDDLTNLGNNKEASINLNKVF